MIENAKEWLRIRLIPWYGKFISQIELELADGPLNKNLPMDMDEYPLQEGMLPEGWQEVKAEATGNHFNDYKWQNNNV